MSRHKSKKSASRSNKSKQAKVVAYQASNDRVISTANELVNAFIYDDSQYEAGDEVSKTTDLLSKIVTDKDPVLLEKIFAHIEQVFSDRFVDSTDSDPELDPDLTTYSDYQAFTRLDFEALVEEAKDFSTLHYVAGKAVMPDGTYKPIVQNTRILVLPVVISSKSGNIVEKLEQKMDSTLSNKTSAELAKALRNEGCISNKSSTIAHGYLYQEVDLKRNLMAWLSTHVRQLLRVFNRNDEGVVSPDLNYLTNPVSHIYEPIEPEETSYAIRYILFSTTASNLYSLQPDSTTDELSYDQALEDISVLNQTPSFDKLAMEIIKQNIITAFGLTDSGKEADIDVRVGMIGSYYDALENGQAMRRSSALMTQVFSLFEEFVAKIIRNKVQSEVASREEFTPDLFINDVCVQILNDFTRIRFIFKPTGISVDLDLEEIGLSEEFWGHDPFEIVQGVWTCLQAIKNSLVHQEYNPNTVASSDLDQVQVCEFIVESIDDEGDLVMVPIDEEFFEGIANADLDSEDDASSVDSEDEDMVELSLNIPNAPQGLH